MGAIEFIKGHGTQNDFVVLPDESGLLELSPARVAALCDRGRGLGADGVLRVVRTAAFDAGESAADWFMDYRNADGSAAEMCGNGARLFAWYLLDAGLVRDREFLIGTRAGDRAAVVHEDGMVTVALGAASITGTSVTTVAGQEFSGVAVEIGNPHLVSFIDEDVGSLDLHEAPAYDRDDFPEGVNLEFVNAMGEDALRMRVYERGVGETRACGTGTVAAVAANLHLAGAHQGSATVHTPGGAVQVTVGHEDSSLRGPVELVARGELDQGWWDSVGGL